MDEDSWGSRARNTRACMLPFKRAEAKQKHCKRVARPIGAVLREEGFYPDMVLNMGGLFLFEAYFLILRGFYYIIM